MTDRERVQADVALQADEHVRWEGLRHVVQRVVRVPAAAARCRHRRGLGGGGGVIPPRSRYVLYTESRDRENISRVWNHNQSP